MQRLGHFVGGGSQLDVVHGVVVEVLLGAPVALGRAGVGVAGRDLDFVEGGAGVQGQGDESVARRVGREVVRDAGLLEPGGEDVPEGLLGEVLLAPVAGDVAGLGFAAGLDEGAEDGGLGGLGAQGAGRDEPGVEVGGDVGGDLDDALFGPLAVEGKGAVALLGAEHGEGGAEDVHAAQAGPEHEGEEGAVAQAQGGVGGDDAEQGTGLGAGESEGLAVAGDAEAAQAGGGVSGDEAAVGGLGEEAADDGELAADGGGGAGSAGGEAGNGLAGEPGAVGVEVVAGDVGEDEMPGFKGGKQLGEVGGVGAAGAGGELAGDEGVREGVRVLGWGGEGGGERAGCGCSECVGHGVGHGIERTRR